MPLDEYCVKTILMQSQCTLSIWNSAVQSDIRMGPDPPVPLGVKEHSNFNKRILKKSAEAALQRGVLRKKCSENMNQIYRITPMLKCNFNKIPNQIYWNQTLAWVPFSCKFTAYFQNSFL